MDTPNLAILGVSLVAGAALLGGCVMEDPESVSPAGPEGQVIQLIESGEQGACLSLDDTGTVECFESEAEADARLAALLPPAGAGADPLAAAPSCVETKLNDSGWTDHLTVTNKCPYTVRVKVILAFGTDLPCHTYKSGAKKSFKWGYPKRFDGLVSC